MLAIQGECPFHNSSVSELTAEHLAKREISTVQEEKDRQAQNTGNCISDTVRTGTKILTLNF